MKLNYLILLIFLINIGVAHIFAAGEGSTQINERTYPAIVKYVDPKVIALYNSKKTSSDRGKFYSTLVGSAKSKINHLEDLKQFNADLNKLKESGSIKIDFWIEIGDDALKELEKALKKPKVDVSITKDTYPAIVKYVVDQRIINAWNSKKTPFDRAGSYNVLIAVAKDNIKNVAALKEFKSDLDKLKKNAGIEGEFMIEFGENALKELEDALGAV